MVARLASLVLVALIAACTGPVIETRFSDVGEELAADCIAAVEEAASIDAMRDTVEDLDEAIRACPDFAQFEAATDLFPAALDGAPAMQFARNRCEFNLDLASVAICLEVVDG